MRGLSTATTAIILVIITLASMLVVFSFYSSYFSGVSANVSQQTYLISLSKMISFRVSQIAFYGIQPALKYFNASYLLWVSAPFKKVTVVIFNTTEQPLSSLYYYAPTAENTYNVGLFTTSKSGIGYSPLNYFVFNGPVYSPQSINPQGNQLLATLSGVRAFNISTNTSYILSAKIPGNNIIVIWVLYYYLGKWYRLDYTYINPASDNLGVYVVSSCGPYILSSALNNPHTTAQEGMSLGFWFKVLSNQTNGTIVTFAYQPVSTSSGQATIMINQTIVNGRAELSITEVSTNLQTYYVPNLYLNQGSWYFVTMSQGSKFGGSTNFYIDVYEPGNLNPIASTSIPAPSGSSNGYVASIRFGDQFDIFAISQAYYASIATASGVTTVNGIPQVTGVFAYIFGNGPFYNNTENMNSVFSQGNLNLLVYWDFSAAITPAPTAIPGYVWVQGSKTNPQLIYAQCHIFPYALNIGWQVDPNDPTNSMGFWFNLPSSNGNTQIQIANFTLYNTSIPVKIINDVYVQKGTLFINITYIEVYGLFGSSGGSPGPSSQTYKEGSITITVTTKNNATSSLTPGDIVVGNASVKVTGLSPGWYYIDIIDAPGQAYAFLASSTQVIYGSGGVPPAYPGAPPGTQPWNPYPPGPPAPTPLQMPPYFANLNEQLLFNLSATLNQNLISQAFYASNMPSDDNTSMLYNFTELMYNKGPNYNMYNDLYWGIQHAIVPPSQGSPTYQGNGNYYLGYKTIYDVVYWNFAQSTQATVWYWIPFSYSTLGSYTKPPLTQQGNYLYYYKDII